MKYFPAQRPARLAGLQDCLEISHRNNGPTWPMFWRTLAMGLIAMAAGVLISVAAWLSL